MKEKALPILLHHLQPFLYQAPTPWATTIDPDVVLNRAKEPRGEKWKVGPYLEVKHGRRSSATLTRRSQLLAFSSLFCSFPADTPFLSTAFKNNPQFQNEKGNQTEVQAITDLVPTLQLICNENLDK